MDRRILLAALVAVAVLAGVLALSRGGGGGKPSIVVCNAGSLTIPLQRLAEGFEKQYGVKVLLEPSGSVEAVRKVTELGKACDVVAVADYRLIPMFMVPRYAKWYIAFASNNLVVVYTDKSRYADEVKNSANPMTVFQVLERPGVRYGFSDPNRDPCGYRAVGVIGLAALTTHNLTLLEDLVVSRIPGSRYELRNGTLHIYIPASPEPRGGLVIRPKSVDLIAMLEDGALDYAFEYRSVAVQHHLRYVELPPEINLGDPGMARLYSRVVVHIMAGTDREKAVAMAPIVYGVTVPVNAPHPREALLFVKYLLEEGRRMFEEAGQSFLKRPLGFGEVPGELRGLVARGEG